MSRDEDALRWEGDDELDRASADAADAAPPDGAEASAPDASAADASADAARERRSRGALGWLTLGLSVASTVGWIAILVVNPVQQPSLVGLIMYQLGELLAVVAPLLWWYCVDRLAPLRRRAPWWIAGVVVTAPWPLVVGPLVGAAA